MNENSKVKDTSHVAGPSVVMGFVIGAVVGAGIALLLAPETGAQTRQRLVDSGKRWRGVVRRKLDEARETVNDLQQDAKSALDAGREEFERHQRSHEPNPTSRTEQKI